MLRVRLMGVICLALLVVALSVAVSGCGKKGPPRPPVEASLRAV